MARSSDHFPGSRPWSVDLGVDHGWVVVHTEGLYVGHWHEIAEMVETSYSLVAPKSLL